LTAHQHLPYPFYTLSRVVNFSVFSLVAFFSYREEDLNFAIAFGVLAFLFNPLHPFYLTRQLWIGVDCIVIGVIGAYLFIKNKAHVRSRCALSRE
jgi:hypothetical protein